MVYGGSAGHGGPPASQNPPSLDPGARYGGPQGPRWGNFGWPAAHHGRRTHHTPYIILYIILGILLDLLLDLFLDLLLDPRKVITFPRPPERRQVRKTIDCGTRWSISFIISLLDHQPFFQMTSQSPSHHIYSVGFIIPQFFVYFLLGSNPKSQKSVK